jgi:hypothetical protein
MEHDISIKFHRILVGLFICLGALLVSLSGGHQAVADTLQIKKPVAITDDKTSEEELETLEGEVLIEALDGSMLFQEMDGKIRILTRSQVADKRLKNEPLEPMTKKEVAQSLLAELPEGFKIHTTDDYVIAYQTERAYAKWIGNLYQGPLKRGFKNFWSKRKFKLTVEEPKFPLVAVIFATRQQYAAQVKRELNIESGSMVAYYNLHTNRVMMYDLTAEHRPAGGPGNGPVKLERDINRILKTRECIPMVTTIIHEGTHQLMFNSGLQTRLADTPLWLNEGIAMYFEPHDSAAKQGWRYPGRTNYHRLGQLRKQRLRPENSLETLVADDARFGAQREETLFAYAESWALTHFLVNRKQAQFGQYLKFLSQKKLQQVPQPGQRLSDFKKFFGDDLLKLDEEFITYAKRLK